MPCSRFWKFQFTGPHQTDFSFLHCYVMITIIYLLLLIKSSTSRDAFRNFNLPLSGFSIYRDAFKLRIQFAETLSGFQYTETLQTHQNFNLPTLSGISIYRDAFRIWIYRDAFRNFNLPRRFQNFNLPRRFQEFQFTETLSGISIYRDAFGIPIYRDAFRKRLGILKFWKRIGIMKYQKIR